MKWYGTFRQFFSILRNMGFRYVAFRSFYEFQLKSGFLKLRFPEKTRAKHFITLAVWRELPVRFFFDSPHWNVKKNVSQPFLKQRVEWIRQGRFQYFGGAWYDSKGWHTNVQNGFVFDSRKHWTTISDFSLRQRDIKYVWEKSRFTFLYDLIRYDHHFGKDQSKVVFSLITDWICQNRVNCGPNWKCGQEITLRVMNWTFALHYYRHSDTLTQEIFDQVTASIYDQIVHVEANINFSRIAVRNNHALTETLGLYLIGLIFPFFPESKRWKQRGKKWFAEEILYQIDEEGTFLQFSMNYHRVVIQLITWALKLAELNDESWPDSVLGRAKNSIDFLRICQDDASGWLPNYGNNDGALFFPLTECHFRDFRPQLAALGNILNLDLGYGKGIWDEESEWLGIEANTGMQAPSKTIGNFQKGGYYIFREHQTITFLRCGAYRSRRRPHQADNLHLDIWVNGTNILRDAGTFSYEKGEKWASYFAGSSAHNTVTLGDFDQMSKQSRFIWSHWITKAFGNVRKEGDQHVIEAEFEGFRNIRNGIIHRRKVVKNVGALSWTIEDWLENAPKQLVMNQIWNLFEYFPQHYQMKSCDESGLPISCNIETGWYSATYGQKRCSLKHIFSTKGRYIKTVLSAVDS